MSKIFQKYINLCLCSFYQSTRICYIMIQLFLMNKMYASQPLWKNIKAKTSHKYFPFTTSETELNYHPQNINVQV